MFTTFQRSFPDITIVEEFAGNQAEDIAFEVPMGSLMHAMPPWPDGFAAEQRFLEPATDKVAEFAEKLTALGEGPKIGFAWRSARQRVGPMKSAPLDLWAPIMAKRNAVFVNLQYGPPMV